MVEAGSGMILGHEMLAPVPGLEAVWSHIPNAIIDLLTQMGAKPKETRVSSPILFGLLQPIAQVAKLKVVQKDRLPMLEEAKEAMFQWLTGKE